MVIRNFEAFCLIIASFVLFGVSGNPVSERPKYTLDPQILAEIKEQLLKGTSTESPLKKFGIQVRLGNDDEEQGIIFREPEIGIELAQRRGVVGPENSPPLFYLDVSGEDSGKCGNRRERFHLGSGKCYGLGLVGGPCGDNMLFYAQEGNKIYGDCDCNYNAEIPLVFHYQTSACYPIYTQAYCQSDEWLVFDPETEKPICERRKCPQDPTKALVYFNSRCVEWYEWDSSCAHAHERVLFLEDSFTPTCAEPPNSEQSNFDIPKLKCKAGSSQDIKGKCKEKIKFNFNG